MKKTTRLLATLCAASVLLSVAGAAPAYAKTHHHTACKRHNYHCHVAKSQISSMVRTAQTSLINIGYYHGKADGIMGPMTKKAVKAFQKDNGFAATGMLTRPTYDAIIKADSTRAMNSLPIVTSLAPPPVPAPQVPREQLGLIPSTNQTYADPLTGGDVVAGSRDQAQSARTKPLESRFAKLDINENINGPIHRYSVTVNGMPVLQVDNQPSVIGVSQTYQMGEEDVIILSTYNQDDNVCPYKHYLMIMAQSRNELRVFGNCTQGYQARQTDGSLFVVFPEFDDQRVAGATWRYENGDLEKL